MSELIEDNQNCFELFGFDFIIDANLKCWLLEANMSPACSERQTQPWFQEMTQTMCDGMVNIIEHKVVRTMSQMTKQYVFGGNLRAKIEHYLSHDSAAFLTEEQLLGWRQVNYDDPIQIPINQ